MSCNWGPFIKLVTSIWKKEAMIASYRPSPILLFEIWRAACHSIAVSSGFLTRLLCSSTLRVLCLLQAVGIRGRGQTWAAHAARRGRGACPVCVCEVCVLSPELAPGCHTDVMQPVLLLAASFCSPSRVGLMTAVLMPDGSHHHHWTAEICLNIVSTIVFFILFPQFSLAVICRQHLGTS